MDLGKSVAKAVWSIVKASFKPCMKIGHAFGLEWMLFLYWIPFSFFGRSSKVWYTKAVTCMLIQLALNYYCKVRGEKSRNFIICLFLFIAKQIKGEKAKGFIAKLNLDSVEEISGMVFGKIKNKYVTKKEKTYNEIS